MTIDAWWPKLRPETREWLIANNGDVVPSSIVEEITEAGGPAQTDDWWVIDHASDGACMPDEAVDWIEEIANEETPLPSGNRVRACPETSGAEPSWSQGIIASRALIGLDRAGGGVGDRGVDR